MANRLQPRWPDEVAARTQPAQTATAIASFLNQPSCLHARTRVPNSRSSSDDGRSLDHKHVITDWLVELYVLNFILSKIRPHLGLEPLRKRRRNQHAFKFQELCIPGPE